jgi:hypothetical protein
MMEMEQGPQQMMERLLARQEEAAAQTAAHQEQIMARLDKAGAEAKTSKELREYIKGHMVATINSVRSDFEQTIQKQMEDALP